MQDETQLAEANMILVDFPDQSGLVQASIGPDLEKWLEKSREALDKAMTTVEGMAYRAAELRERIPDEFTHAEIEFGVTLDFEAGALLAKAGAEASIKVNLTWERGEKKTDSQG